MCVCLVPTECSRGLSQPARIEWQVAEAQGTQAPCPSSLKGRKEAEWRAELLHPWALFPQLFPSLLRWCNPQATLRQRASPLSWPSSRPGLPSRTTWGLHAHSDPVAVTKSGGNMPSSKQSWASPWSQEFQGRVLYQEHY